MENLDRIIGEFLEINADIYTQRVTSKAPKLISYIRAKYFYNKLNKRVNKFKKSNYILTKDNLYEYFMYLYNNYPPYGQYKSARKIIYTESTEELSVIYGFNEYSLGMNIEKDRKDFNIIISRTVEEKTESFDIYVYKLAKGTDLKINSILKDDINRQILNELCEYIMDTIKLYEPKLWEK